MAIEKSMEVLNPGLLTTVQDLGRYGFGGYGVPPSGAVDSFSLRAANLLAGNAEGEACLEITLAGFSAEFLADLVIAITGGDLQPLLNGLPIRMWEARRVKRGDRLSFNGPKSGCRAYVAVGGGFSVDPVLGSKSTNLSSGFGGYEGRALQKGDLLCTTSPHLHLDRAGRSLPADRIPRFEKERQVRVLPGPQYRDFPPEETERFFASSYTVTPHSDRTGIRLSGPKLQRAEGLPESVISEGVVPGSIQIPGDGQPIVLLVETVSGGYRKIANVISADLFQLGQAKPGDKVAFREVSAKQALEALRAREEILRELLPR